MPESRTPGNYVFKNFQVIKDIRELISQILEREWEREKGREEKSEEKRRETQKGKNQTRQVKLNR